MGICGEGAEFPAIIMKNKWRYVNMDNNQNNMFNSQPVNNQPEQPQQQAGPFGQQPQQAGQFGQQPQQAGPFEQQQAGPFGQQQPQQGGNPFGNQFAPKKPMNVSLGLIAMICSAVSLVMAIIGSIFACTCSASKSYDAVKMAERMLKGNNMYSTSAVIIVNIIAAVIAVAAVVLAIIALKKDKADKIAKVAAALGGFAFLYAVLPMLTVCGYNCSLSNASKDAISGALGSLFK